MKNNKSSFEDFIREKISSSEFQFEEQHWEKANIKIAELSAEDKKRKRRMAAWIFFSMLLIGLGTFGVWRSATVPRFTTQAGTPSVNTKHVKGQSSETVSAEVKKGLEVAEIENAIAQTDAPSIDQNKHGYPTSTQLIGKGGKDTIVENKVDRSNHKVIDLTNIQVGLISPEIKKGTEIQQLEQASSLLDDEANVNAERLFAPDRLPLSNLNRLFSNKEDDHSNRLIDVKMRKPSHWGVTTSFHFGTGTGITPSLQDLRSTEANLHLTYRISPRWQAAAGVGYTFIYGGVPMGDRVQTTYGFVATTTRYEWGLKQIHFLHLPIGFTFEPAARHEISFGGHAFYRLRTSGDLTVFRGTTLEVDTPVLSEKDIDYGASLPLWNIQTSVGYGYQFNKQLTVGAEFRHGLTDLLDDSFFGKNNRDRAAFVGLFIKYKL